MDKFNNKATKKKIVKQTNNNFDCAHTLIDILNTRRFS